MPASTAPRLCIAAVVLGACSPQATPASVELVGYAPANVRGLRAAGWRTDFARTIVGMERIRASDLPRDAFLPIRDPRFAPADALELDPREPVLVHRGGGRVRVWPLMLLLRRELALDVVEGVPVAVTFCSLCGSARVWDLRLGGCILDLSVSGLLLDGNALLWDAGTESLWSQLDGVAVAGQFAGHGLRALPAFTVSFGALRAAHPDAQVMLDPGEAPDPPFACLTADDVARGELPSWMSAACADPLARVLCLEPLTDPVIVLHDPASAAVHRGRAGATGPAIGSSAAFSSALEGLRLTFDLLPTGGATDRQTGSCWNPLGEAVDGPLRGRALQPVPHAQTFRFAHVERGR